jgi:hypothetical protein
VASTLSWKPRFHASDGTARTKIDAESANAARGPRPRGERTGREYDEQVTAGAPDAAPPTRTASASRLAAPAASRLEAPIPLRRITAINKRTVMAVCNR